MSRNVVLMLALLLFGGAQEALAAEWIVGIAISSNDRTYAWFSDGVVTSGSTSDFENRTHAEPFKPPPGRKPGEIVAIAIAKSNDRVYTWFQDGKVSVGSTKNLDRHVPLRTFTLPLGKTVANIAGIGIAGDDRVHAWYKDGTFSIGTFIDLDRHSAPRSYTLPPGFTHDDLVELDIRGSDGHVYAWYRTGFVSAGTAADLDRHRAPDGFIPAEFIYRSWGPQLTSLLQLEDTIVGADERTEEEFEAEASVGTLQPAVGEHPEFEMAGVSPTPSAGPFLATGNGSSVDPMIAVGNQFLIVSDTGRLGFFDKQGNSLPPKNGVPSSMTTANFFGGFVAKNNPDGSFNDRNINLYLRFPKPCDSPDYPQTTTGKRFCTAEFYDTRVHFDPASRRFFVMSNSRPHLKLDTEHGGCVQYHVPLSKVRDTSVCDNRDDETIRYRCTLHSNEFCDLPRRLVAFAVSKTEDPRDGFHQYMLTENEYRDWPWMGVNGDHLIIAHNAEAEGVEPVVSVVSVTSVKSGQQHPAYFRYYPADFDGLTTAIPPVHHGNTGGLTFLLSKEGNRLDIFAFPQTPNPWRAPAMLRTSVTLGDKVPPLTGSVYRAGRLHFVVHKKVEENGGAKRYSVRAVRVPVKSSLTSLTASTNPAEGFIDWFFGLNATGDPPGSRVSYERPSVAVNRRGDMLFAYGRYPFSGPTPSLFPEARYTLWRAGEPKQLRSRLLKAGEAAASESIISKLDYATAVVDPSDDKSFWVAHTYANSSGGYRTVFGKITP